MGELKKTYRTTIRDVESQVVVDVMFIPKAVLHDEVRESPFKALRAMARAFDAPMQEAEPRWYEQGEFSSNDLAKLLGITGFLASDLFERDDIIVGEMSKARLTAITTLIGSGVAIGTLAAASGPIVLLYCSGGILVVGAGVLIVGGALKTLGY